MFKIFAMYPSSEGRKMLALVEGLMEDSIQYGCWIQLIVNIYIVIYTDVQMYNLQIDRNNND